MVQGWQEEVLLSSVCVRARERAYIYAFDELLMRVGARVRAFSPCLRAFSNITLYSTHQ